MARIAPRILLSQEEHEMLKSWSKSRSVAYRLVIRSRIILMAADGHQNLEISASIGVSRPTVQLWRERFLALRLAGLEREATRPGRKPKIPPDKVKEVIDTTLNSRPENGSFWSTRAMAKKHGISDATVRRIWRKYSVKHYKQMNFEFLPGPLIEQENDPKKIMATSKNKKRNVRRNQQSVTLPAAMNSPRNDTAGPTEQAENRRLMGATVKHMRKERGLSKLAFSKLCKISLKALTDTEAGNYKVLHFYAILDALGIGIKDFVHLALEKFPRKRLD